MIYKIWEISNANPNYYIQQNYHSQSMEKEQYSMIKPKCKQFLSTNLDLQKALKKNFYLKRLTTPKKKGINNSRTVIKWGRKNPHHNNKITKFKKHCIMIILNTNVLNSLIKRHRLTDLTWKQKPFFMMHPRNTSHNQE